MEITLDRINDNLGDTEECIRDLEGAVVETTQPEQQKEKKKNKTENSLRDLWNNITCSNIHFIDVPEGEGRQKGIENTFNEITD